MTDRTKKLARILQMGAEACPCGRSHPISLQQIVMGEDALCRLPDILTAFGVYTRPVMVCDTNTYTAAGRRVEILCKLAATVCLTPTAGGVLHANEAAVADVEAILNSPLFADAPCDLLLAVGSGTIHDITRYVAAARGISFVSVPTAASVDGFLSSIAAMTWQGVKRSFPAISPIALVADSTVIAAAPLRLTASGVGDLLGKYTALFDWRVSHIVTGEYICREIVSLEEQAIAEVAACLQDIQKGDAQAVETVMFGLILSGLAMQMVGNSRPASGAEHHISHFMEMEVLTQGDTALHGEKVGVAAALVADAYHRLLSSPLSLDRCRYRSLPQTELHTVFGSRTDEVIKNENTPDPLAEVNITALCTYWDDIRSLAHNTLPTGDDIRRMLAACGAPVSLHDIGIPESLSSDLYAYAPYVRHRLTLMRLEKLIEK